MELIPNLHMIEGQRSNIYLWLGDGGPILVDAGMPNDRDKIVSYIAEIGLKLAELKAIFITHADLDHAGSAASIQAQSGATVYAGSETATFLKKGKSPNHMPLLVQLVIDQFMSYPRLPSEVLQIVGDTDTVLESFDWQALATPGHTLDHYAFYSPTYGILFAGDALSTRGDRLQGTPKRITADWNAAIDSAKRLLLLHAATIACGHGRPFINYDANIPIMLYRELDQETG